MKTFPVHKSRVLLVALAVMSSSCDRNKQVMLEKQQAETEFQRLTSEHRMYEGKFLSLGPNAHSAALVIERQAAAAEQQAAALSVELNGLNGKVVALEAALNKFKPLVETYKAKNSR